MDLIAADNIDRIMNIEMRRRGLPRGSKWAMFEMARDAAGGSLVAAAARVLNRPEPTRFLIVTGAAVPDFMPVGENDGPIGTIVLARALIMLGHSVDVLTDPACAGPLEGLARYLELPVRTIAIGMDDSPMQDRMFDSHDMIVSIERLGGNVNGFLHGVNGKRRDTRANFDRLFARARAEGKPTFSIGDGGNEIGFGNVYDRLSTELADHAHKDVTPCGGGVFSVVKSDLLLVANSSNVGAYAAAAGLALATGRLELCLTAELDVALAHVGCGLGLVDGANGALRPWCDGIPPAANAAVVEIMRNIVERSLEQEYVRKF